MQPALHRGVVNLAFGQWHLGVRAHVAQGEDLAVGARHGDGLAVHLDADDALGGQFRQRADPLEIAHETDPSSSASMAPAIRIRSSGTSMVSISWPKNPRITSLRASANGMPLAIR